jgi:protoheme IX farnesyltransferase
MKRTANRPLPAGRLDRQSALHFGVGLSFFSVILMYIATNWVAAAILAASILFYVLIYTVWLKRRTPQNIVIGGAAGAFPPMIGWAAVTGDVSLMPILLFALIFMWTPPHFWALALFMKSDYAKAGVPMMPVVAGERSTRIQIFIYTLIMSATAMAPWALRHTGQIYGLTAAIGSVLFIALSIPVLRRTSDEAMQAEKRLFKFSILYFALFGALALEKTLFA